MKTEPEGFCSEIRVKNEVAHSVSTLESESVIAILRGDNKVNTKVEINEGRGLLQKISTEIKSEGTAISEAVFLHTDFTMQCNMDMKKQIKEEYWCLESTLSAEVKSESKNVDLKSETSMTSDGQQEFQLAGSTRLLSEGGPRDTDTADASSTTEQHSHVSFTQISDFENCSLVVDEGQTLYKCNICDKSFTTAGNFVHECKIPHQCNICDKRFTSLGMLKTHHLIHNGQKTYNCKICDQRFTRADHLKTHNLIHDGKRPHKCKICEKSFTAAGNLRIHNFIHGGESPHKCNVCEKSFTRADRLKKHNLIHEGKRPHKCKICEMGFTTAGNLKKHNLIHEGKELHMCKICDKSFTKAHRLKTHNLMHDGKTPYKCYICERNYTTAYNLKEHKLKAHLSIV